MATTRPKSPAPFVPLDVPADRHLPRKLTPDPLTLNNGASDFANLIGQESPFANLPKYGRDNDFGAFKRQQQQFAPSDSVLRQKREVVDAMAHRRKAVKDAKGKLKKFDFNK